MLILNPEAESKEKHGVWDPMPELTITSPCVHSRVDSNPFTMGIGQPYDRVDWTVATLVLHQLDALTARLYILSTNSAISHPRVEYFSSTNSAISHPWVGYFSSMSRIFLIHESVISHPWVGYFLSMSRLFLIHESVISHPRVGFISFIPVEVRTEPE